jgi:Chaperone of endosialidase
MPVTPTLDSFLGRIAAMQRQLDELTRAVGRPSDQIRDTNDNVVHMVPGAENPILGARDQDIALSLTNGTVAVTDGVGRDPRPISASNFNGPVTGDTTGTHHGDVGTSSEFWHHYGDVTGNTFGFHYGPVGDGSTQYQINALNVFSTGHFGVQHGDVGVGGDNWQLHGTVIAPSERRLKEDIREFSAGKLVDAVPSYRWKWRRKLRDDADEHAGPMVDDLAEHAPWLVRGTKTRGYGVQDLVGILWAALREERVRTADLESRIAHLEGTAE